MFTAPGVYYSDYVIAQSQRVKEIFESYGHNEEKIIAFGSPKIDAIVKNNKNTQKLPETWTKKLSNKKIFLLNTHLSYFPKAFQYAESPDNYAVKFHSFHQTKDLFFCKKAHFSTSLISLYFKIYRHIC